MSEIGDVPQGGEAKAENKTVRKVKDAVGTAMEKTKETNREYWEIRKELQDRLAWHGGGVYKQYVENMDKVTDAFWGSKDLSGARKIMAGLDKGWTRFKGATTAGGAAVVDIAYNVASWPFRLVLPLPKDPAKRFVLYAQYGELAAKGLVAGVVAGAVSGAGAVASGEAAINKGIKGVAEAVLTAPEVAAIGLKRKVSSIVENMKKPKPVKA